MKKENRHLYNTPSFKAAREVVRVRADGRCECLGACDLEHDGGRCNAPNGEVIWREVGNPAAWTDDMRVAGDAETVRGVRFRPVRVVLTTAHLDHDAGTDNPDRMRFFCQLCHVRYDRHQHAASAKVTLSAKKEAASRDAGQGALPLGGSR